MPRKSKPPEPHAWQKSLSRLPRRAELVIEGGKRQLGLYIRENRQTLQPQLALWVQGDSEFVRATRVISPSESADDGITQALEALVEAIAAPMPVPILPTPQPGLPSKVVVNDKALAEAAHDLLAPLGILVEYAAHIPAFEEAFLDLSAALGATGDGPPEPFEWDIDEELLLPLYAAASYWRRAPWDYLGSDLPISIELGSYGPQPGVDTLYAVVLGNAGEVFGVAFYYALEAFERTIRQGMERMARGAAEGAYDVDEDDEIGNMIELMRQAGAPVDDVPPDELRRMVGGMMEAQGLSTVGTAREDQADEEEYLSAIEDNLVVYFDTTEDSDPFYLEWLADRKLKYSSKDTVPSFHRMVEHAGPVNPGRQEVVALTLALESLSDFFSTQRRAIVRRYPPDFIVLPRTGTDRIEHTASVNDPKAGAKRLEVRVSLPAEGYLP
ncbi:MAG TPA: hypothetical protein VGE04_01420 [Chloroflexia bacterium]|jgi:hypothetical protein